MSKKAFLLSTSFNFDDSNLIDNIRQTFLDLHANADEQSVQGFLDESFSYLRTDYQIDIAKELLPVISLCFSLYPQYSLPLADKFLKADKINEYLIISSVSIVFELTNNKLQIDLPNYQSFIDDCLKEIHPQIQNQDFTKLIIFGKEISHQYQNSLILDLLLSSKLTKELFSNFYPYIFKKNLFLTNPKFDILLSKLIEADFVKILPLTESSIYDLLQIIEKRNILEFDTKSLETLLFISQVTHFTKTEGKSYINGLTEETVLPFTAITTIYYHFSQFISTFSEKRLTNLLLDSIKNLNDKSSSKLNKESINFILKNLDEIESNQLISKSTAAEIIAILARKLIQAEFTVDKIFLLSLLFNHFLKGSDELDTNVKKFVENEGKSLFDYIFNNLNEINNSIKLPKLNLSVFDKQMLTKYLKSKLESEKPIQTVYFLENFCHNVPRLNISPEILGKIEEKSLDNFLLITRFMKKNLNDEDFKKIKDTIPKNIQISLSDEIPAGEMDIDDLLSYILTDSHDNQDKSMQLFNLLFDKLTTDKQMLQNYLMYTIDFFCSFAVEAKVFLMHYMDQYEKYQKEFTEAACQRFYRHTKGTITPNIDFKLSDLPIPESGINVIDKLFKYANENKATYQLFLCMKNLVCSFPFLFKNHLQQILDLVLPNFDYTYLLFDQNANEKSKELAKVAYSSLSFLFSSLKFPEILEDFFDWLTANIFSFTNSQILGFIIILYYIFNNEDFSEIAAIVVEKYKFLNTLQNLLDREIEEKEGKYFESFYKESICLLISQMMNFITKITTNGFPVLKSCFKSEKPITNFITNNINRLQNIQIKNSIENEHFSKQIQDFIINTDYIRDFWISENFDMISVKMPSRYQIYTFYNKFKDKQYNDDDDDDYDDEICDPIFAALIAGFYKTGPVLYSNIKPYCEAMFRIATMESIDDSLFSIFLSAFIQICSNKENISSYNDFIFSIIKEFDENSIGSESPSSLNVMRHIIDILSIFAQYNKMTITQAIELLSIVLSPKWRTDSTLLMKMVYLLRFYPSLPVSILQAIEFDVLQSKIIGERDIATIQNICDLEIKQLKVNQYYKHYSDLGKKQAIVMYGILIKDGICLKADIPLALTYIKKAIDFEDPTALAYYALMLYKGNGVDKNVDEGLKLLQKAADNGSDIAINEYGSMIETGTNFEKNINKAVILYKKAIDKYNMKALYNLALIISTDHEHLYYKCKDNVRLAALLFKKAADQGILDSLYKYGIFELDISYILKAAKKGNPKAIKEYILHIIEDDECESPENIEWLQKGVELGISGALSKYSSCLEANKMENLAAKKFNLLDFANEDDLNAMTEYHREQWEKKGFTGNSFKEFAQEADQYIDILKQYKKDNTKVFVDENFHPFKKWKRIDEIYDVPLFKRELIDPSFIIQGYIGDCCLISALY